MFFIVILNKKNMGKYMERWFEVKNYDSRKSLLLVS